MSKSLSHNQVESLLRAVNAPDDPRDDRRSDAGHDRRENQHDGTSGTSGTDASLRNEAGFDSNRHDKSHRGSGGSNSDASGNSFRIDSAHTPVRHVTRESVDSVANRPASTPSAEPYDFRWPPQLGRNEVQAIQVLSDVVAIQFARSVSTLMRGDIQCQLINVDQSSHQDFVYDMDDPSCFCVINPSPLSGQWMMNIPSTLLFAMIDRMLGGDPLPGESPQRPMTEIEKRLISRVIEEFLSNVRQAWQRVTPITPQIVSINNHPHCISSVPASESVVRIRYSATIGNVRGEFWFAIPRCTIDHLSDRLDSQNWESELSKEPTQQSRQSIANQLADSPISVVVNLAQSTISTRDLLGLSVGDVIATEKPISDPMELAIADVPKFKVRAGALHQKVAVQIESTLEKP